MHGPARKIRLCPETRALYCRDAVLDLALSLTVLAAIALLAGAWALWRRTGNRKQPLLMILLALIALVNVAIWTVPDKSGQAPLDKIDGQPSP